ncbi:MAG: hypothetical protein EXR71_10240 [Myxococcales bacterium]|nr:hypothetical protein [Myxococcales bacterium]
MNLHRIAGRNLASLEDPFEILLDEGPLAQLGLFAITGPTGSGKSTLLDALCVALYGDTPRLHGRGGVEIGDGADTYRTHDARSLVRRGADAAFAEVEFTGVDDVRYIAHWSVRKRPRAGGLDAPSLTLRAVAGSTVEGGTRTETLARIVEVVGLDFKAFVQSVLLAQGEFARLLHATGDDRGEALEWITRSGLYSDLSRIAHTRASAVEAGVREELAALRGIPRLSDADRGALADRLVTLAAALPPAAAQVRRLQAARVWHDGKASLAGELVGLEAGAAEATAAVFALHALRGQLDLADRAWKLAVPLAGADQAASALQGHHVATQELEAAHATASAAVGPAETLLGSANSALAAALQAQEAGAEPLKEARRLDALVQAAHAASLAALEKLSAADTGLTGAREALAAAVDAAATEARGLTKLDAWLGEHATAVTLAPAWSGTGPVLTDWAATATAGDVDAMAAEKARTAAQAAEAAAVAAEAPARAANDAAEAARGARDAAVDPQEAALAAGLTTEADDIQNARTRLAEAEAHHQVMSALDRRVVDALAAGDAAAKAKSAATTHHHAAVGALAEIDIRHDEAKRQQRELEARQDLSAHRAALEPGKECPLCGATEHRIAADARFDEAVADARSRVSELGAHRDATTRELSGEAARIEAAEVAARTAAKDAQAVAAQIAALTGRHGAADSADALLASRAQLLTRERALTSAVAAQRQRSLDYRRLAEAADAAGAAVDGATAALHEARQRGAAQSAEHHALAARAADLVARAATLANRLAPQLGSDPDWAIRLRSPTARAALAAEVAQAIATAKARADGEHRATAAATALAIKQSEVRSASTHQAREAEYQELAVASATALRALRAAALIWPDADAYESLLAGPVHGARVGSEAAGKDLNAARSGAASAARVLDAHTRALPALLGAASAARSALDDALAAAELSEPDARACLGRGDPWRTASERHWNDAVAASARAELVAEETRRRLAELQSAPPEGAGESAGEDAEAEAATLPARLVTAEAQHASLLVAIGTTEATLAGDQQRRDEYRLRDEALGDARADAEAWGELKATIGHADGKTLRCFAQALTLSRLLEEANQVLDDLAPRYQLEGVEHSRLELKVIDRERGNEARGVNTLSGGETFLLSLALALGLSNVAARRQPVNCLFIDEGFGALDPRALDQALAMLEGLQQRGRIIGIISHVPGLAERVGARVDIVPTGPGTSQVVVVAG